MADGTDALVIRVCREATACSTPRNPDLITLVKRTTTVPLDLANITTITELQRQFQPNTEQRIIKRPHGPAEQCGVQDPRIVYDPTSQYYLLAYTGMLLCMVY